MPLTYTWFDADNQGFPLSTPPTLGVLFPGASGLDMPRWAFSSDAVPLQHGERLRTIRAEAREVELPLHISANSAFALRNQIQTLLHALNPLRGDGALLIE